MTRAETVLRCHLRELGERMPRRSTRRKWLRLWWEGFGHDRIASLEGVAPLLVEDVLRVEMAPRRITVRRER